MSVRREEAGASRFRRAELFPGGKMVQGTTARAAIHPAPAAAWWPGGKTASFIAPWMTKWRSAPAQIIARQVEAPCERKRDGDRQQDRGDRDRRPLA
ncbi:MAG: hypothetical protein ABR610_06305 [Thermoanaerobaculia bacterium]